MTDQCGGHETGGCVVLRRPCDRSGLLGIAKEGGVVSKWRRTSWQQLIIAQTNFLEYERTRLCPDDRQNGVAGQRSSACHASDAAKRHLDDARQAAGIPTRQPPVARLRSGRPMNSDGSSPFWCARNHG